MANVGMHRHVGFYVDILPSCPVAVELHGRPLETRLDSSHIISLTPQLWQSRWQ